MYKPVLVTELGFKKTGDSYLVQCKEGRIDNGEDMRVWCKDDGEWTKPNPCVLPPMGGVTSGIYDLYEYVGCYVDHIGNFTGSCSSRANSDMR